MRKNKIILMVLLAVLLSSSSKIITCQEYYAQAIHNQSLQKITKATELYFKCRENCDDPVIMTESRYKNALMNFNRISKLVNPCQRYDHADATVNMWLEYIEWYLELDDDQIYILKENNSDKIQKAIRLLGNTIRERGVLPP
ncbi:hypothetical protein E1176_01545, partial [Fulvivirga sp. RKSG066]|uniref:hypothetical protein n=1 Tax=Fulvivirga aurantia TaxID=2529383 RepID=UPI0012BBC27D